MTGSLQNDAEFALTTVGFRYDHDSLAQHRGGTANDVIVAQNGGEARLVRLEKEPLTQAIRDTERLVLEWGGPRRITPRIYGHGVAPSGRYFTVQEFLRGRIPSVNDFRAASHRQEALRLLASFHNSGLSLPGRKTIFGRALSMLGDAEKVQWPDSPALLLYKTLCSQLSALKEEVEARETKYHGPVHNDVIFQNLMLLDGGGGLRLLDFHRAAMGCTLLDVVNAGGRLFVDQADNAAGVRYVLRAAGLDAEARLTAEYQVFGQHLLSAGYAIVQGNTERFLMMLQIAQKLSVRLGLF